MSVEIRIVPIPPERCLHRGILAPYVDAAIKAKGKAVVVPLGDRSRVDMRASLFTLAKRRGYRVHVYAGATAGECIAWVERWDGKPA